MMSLLKQIRGRIIFRPVIRHFTNSERNIDNTNEEIKKKFEYVPKKEEIFNKKTHYRNLEVENKIEPPKDFEAADEKEMIFYEKKLMYPKSYVKIQNDWQKNLEKKKRKKAKSKEAFENLIKPEPMEEKFVVHVPEKEISIPAPDEKLFAVVSFKGLQHKVTKDDKIILEKTDLNAGDTFFFDKVLLVSSDEYTSVGRPLVKSAKVLAQVEENSKSEKVIIFKKKRRKGYQRNQGHRQDLTVVRILKIIHNPTEETIDNYQPLLNKI